MRTESTKGHTEVLIDVQAVLKSSKSALRYYLHTSRTKSAKLHTKVLNNMQVVPNFVLKVLY